MNITAGPVLRTSAALGLILPLLLTGLAASKPERPAKLIDTLLKGLGTEREPGAAIMVLKEGEVIYLGARGVADLQAMRPIDGRSNFLKQSPCIPCDLRPLAASANIGNGF